MNSLVIVGRYPFPDRRLEGMVQRIANIDMQIAERPRTYLDLYAFKHLRSTHKTIGKVQIYTASFLSFLAIYRILMSAQVVYIHSIYFYALIFLPLLFTGNQVRLILDMHGAVPEEIRHSGPVFLSRVMGIVERAAFSRIEMAVCVTRRMEKFYQAKYSNSLAKYLYLPIFTTQVCRPADVDKVNALRAVLGIPHVAKVYLYSGGLQPWQNIDLMLKVTTSLIASQNNWCIFLTAEKELLTKQIKNMFGYLPTNIIIAHVKPDELCNYYELANFGFILRDDHILNRVANPTKLIEYLYFGMRPIVSSADIGDFIDLGYEYISIDALDDENMVSTKSEINHRISIRLLADVKLANLSEHI